MSDASSSSAPQGFFHLDEVSPLTTVLLRHLGDQGFELAQSFMFRGPSGEFRIDQRDLPNTDLTSVPWFYRWYIPRYGPHLLPALLHDRLVELDTFDRDDADDVFGEALEVQGVAPLRRVVMLAAVTLATRWERWSRRILLIIWFLLAGLGMLVVANALGRWWRPSWWTDWLAWAAVLAPLPAGALWGKHWARGIVAGYSLIVLAPVTVAIWITRGITGLFEASVE